MPKSQGSPRLTGPGPYDHVQIEANTVAFGRYEGRPSLRQTLSRGRQYNCTSTLYKTRSDAKCPEGSCLENFIRDGATTFHHQTCTAKMGCDAMLVVNARLQVYGIQNVRIADGSIMPRVTTGNTIAPCVIIGERASELLQNDHKV